MVKEQLTSLTRSDYNEGNINDGTFMIVLNLTEAKAKFSQVVEKALQGEEIVITKMGKPAVKISSYTEPKTFNRLGFMQGQAKIPDDFDQWPSEEAEALGIIDKE